MLPEAYTSDIPGSLQDAWGTRYRYQSDGDTYHLISYGKDRERGPKDGFFDADMVVSQGRLVAPEHLKEQWK